MSYALIQRRALLTAGVGLLALIIGVVIGHIKVGISGYGSISALQANQLCSTGIGSLVQGFDSTVSSACSTAGTVASIHGLLIGFGWLLLIGGLIGTGLAAWANSQNPGGSPGTSAARSQGFSFAPGQGSPGQPVPPAAPDAPARAAYATPEAPDIASTDTSQP